MNNNPKVSVIIPVYNSGEYIEESICSARNQSYNNIEIVVIDDGSNQETKKKLNELSSQIDVFLVQENLGPSAARNNGINNATGDLILILDSDDYFKPTFLEKAVKIISDNKSVKFVSCFLNRFEGKKIGPIVKMNGGELNNFLFRNASIGNGLFRKSDILEAGGYDENMRDGYVDWELIIRVLKSGGTVEIIPKPLFMYRSNLKIITNRAKEKRPEILHYIFMKHTELYKDNFHQLIDFFTQEQNKLILRKNSVHNTKEYKLGQAIIRPLRVIKNLWR